MKLVWVRLTTLSLLVFITYSDNGILLHAVTVTRCKKKWRDHLWLL